MDCTLECKGPSDPRAPAAQQGAQKDAATEFNPAGGEAAIMIPVLVDKARTVKANISLDAGLLEAIDEAAQLRGLTRSAFLSSAATAKIVAQE